MAAGYFMRNPPDGWKPAGWTPSASQSAQRAAKDYTLVDALRTWQWWALWVLLFLNTSAGISVVSQESPMFQEFAKASVIVAAGMVGIANIGNAVGRIFWAWTSDASTRRWTFTVMFLLQVGLFWTLPGISSVTILQRNQSRCNPEPTPPSGLFLKKKLPSRIYGRPRLLWFRSSV